MKIGFLFNVGAFWIGAHWSKYNRRLCVNLLPFFTVWFVFEGGKTPIKGEK